MLYWWAYFSVLCMIIIIMHYLACESKMFFTCVSFIQPAVFKASYRPELYRTFEQVLESYTQEKEKVSSCSVCNVSSYIRTVFYSGVS